MTQTQRAPTTRRRTCTPGAAAFGEFVGMLLCTAAIVYAVWSTVIAFAGGPLPLTQARMSGGPGLGLAWIFVADPLIMSLALGVTYVLTVPIRLACAWRYGRVAQRVALATSAEPEDVVIVLDSEPEAEPASHEREREREHVERPVPARPRPDAVRPRGDVARRGQPASRQRELVVPDTP